MKRTRYLLRCWLAGIALGAVVGALFAACCGPSVVEIPIEDMAPADACLPLYAPCTPDGGGPGMCCANACAQGYPSNPLPVGYFCALNPGMGG